MDTNIKEYSEKKNIESDTIVEEKRNISERLYRWIAIKLIDGEKKY